MRCLVPRVDSESLEKQFSLDSFLNLFRPNVIKLFTTVIYKYVIYSVSPWQSNLCK